MKKNNPYITDDEIDLGDLIKSLWREKILILSISIICGLAGYLYASFQPKYFKTVIYIKNPPSQLFESYKDVFKDNVANVGNVTNLNSFNNLNGFNNPNSIAGQYIFDFSLNFLSIDNLQNFTEESIEFDNFKEYLKLRNISAKSYFVNKIDYVKEKNLIIPNKYYLVYPKELNGDIFLNNYSEFVKKITIFELKKNLKLTIDNKIIIHEQALEKAKLINLEMPIIHKSFTNQNSQVVNEPMDLFYKGSKVLTQEIISNKKLLIKLENEQFNYEHLLDKSLSSQVDKMSNFTYSVMGIMLGLFLSLGVIFYKSDFKNN